MNYVTSPITKPLQKSKILSYNKSAPPASRQAGQSLIEMALAMLVVLIILSGIVDVGRLFYNYLALKEAAAEGATFASFCPPWEPENNLKIIDRIRTSSDFPVDLSRTEVFISITYVNPPARGSQIYVQVTDTGFKFITPLLTGFNPYPLTAAVQMMAGVDECQVTP